MSRSKLFIFLAATLAFALAVFISHLKARNVSTGTPVPQALVQLAYYNLPPHASDCLDQVAVEPGSQVALFAVDAPGGQPGTAFRFTISGDSYTQVHDVPAGYPPGQMAVPFEGPRSSLLAEVCIHNLGDREVLIRGTNEPRTLSRPRMTIGGTPTDGEFSLAFQTVNGQSKFALVGTIARHISAFKPIWVQPWLVIALLLVVLAGAFVAPLVALWRSFGLDERQ